MRTLLLRGACALLVALTMAPTGCATRRVLRAGPLEKKLSPAQVLQRYRLRVASVERERRRLGRAYRAARSPARRGAILERARRLITRTIDRRLFPAWAGTQWNFYGTSERPRHGKIACGYFVSTVLRDIGFRVQRAPLARLPAELIIKSLTGERFIRRFSRVPLPRFVESVRLMGEGLYIVGLDTHVGFMVVRGRWVYFVHTGRVVVREIATRSYDLAVSKYRVVGKVSADNSLLRKWLSARPIASLRFR